MFTIAIVALVLLLVLAITQLISASAAAELPARGKITRVSGGRLHWVEAGSGRPVVMIHGLAGNLFNFTYALTDAVSGEVRTIAVDRPGCGWSERDGVKQASLAEQARMIAEFIETEELGRPVIVGHSMGGTVAVLMALNHPEQVGGLVLLCPATAPIEKTPPAFRGIDIPMQNLVPTIGHAVSGLAAKGIERSVLEQVFAPEPVAPNFFLQGGAILARRASSFISAAQDLAASRNGFGLVVGREADIKVPVSVVYGAADAVLDPALHGRTFSEKAGADYTELEGRGHMIPVTAPAECAEVVRRMLERVPA